MEFEKKRQTLQAVDVLFSSGCYSGRFSVITYCCTPISCKAWLGMRNSSNPNIVGAAT